MQADLNGMSWEDIVWGSETGATLSGRAVMGIKIALDLDAKLLLFPTGASVRDGVKEGAYTYQEACARVEAIAHTGGYPKEQVRALLEEHAEVELESQNTREECEYNFRRCIALGIERIVLVSSPWHIERCLVEAFKVAGTMRASGEAVPEIFATASHGSTEGVVVLEPSHRGDVPKNTYPALGARFFKVPEEKREVFEQKFDQLLSEQGA